MDEQTTSLVARSRAGDREAYGQLVAVCQKMALATGRRILGNHHDAMDVVQESFLLAWVRLGQLQDDQKFEPWLRTIIQRAAVALVRQRASRQQMEAQTEAMRRRPPDGAGCPSGPALDLLPNQLREPVMLHYVYNWPYQRIAQHLQVPVTTIKGRLQQARRRLRPGTEQTAKGRRTMGSTPLSEKVHEAIRHIETQEFHQTIPLEGARNVVLFCGMLSDVELCQTEGDAVVINGTKACLAPTPESAQEMLSDIKLQADRVDDYLASGPHEAVIFCGTQHDSSGNLMAITRKASTLLGPGGKGIDGTSSLSQETRQLFPHLAQPCADIEPLARRMMQEALRISVTRDRIRDVVIPAKQVSEEALRLVRANFNNGQVIHGDTGRVSMTVALPRDCGIVLLMTGGNGVSVHAEGLHNDLLLIRPARTTVTRIDGNVIVLDGLVQDVSEVTGRFIQTWYGLGAGGNGPDDSVSEYHRMGELPVQSLRKIAGGTDFDCLKCLVHGEDLGGPVRVRNVMGQTTIAKAEHREGDRLRLQTDSGEIRVRLAGQLVKQISVTLSSAAGRLVFPALQELQQAGDLSIANDNNLMSVSTIRNGTANVIRQGALDADIVAQSREGTITVEALEAPVTPAG